jgi:hypothetical protein
LDSKNKKKLIRLAVLLVVAASLYFGYVRWFHSQLLGRDSLLHLMPGDAETVFFMDLSDVRRAPFFADVFAWVPNPNADAEYSQFVRDTRFNYETDLDRLAVAFEKQGARQIFFAVAEGRFDQTKIKKYAAGSGAVQKQAGIEIFSLPVAGRPERISFAFLRSDAVAFTSADNLTTLLKPPAPSESADWRVRFERVAGSPIFAVIRNDGINEALGIPISAGSLAQRATGGFTSPQLSSLLKQLQWITVAAKPENDRLRVIAEGESSEDENARQLADLLNGVVLLARAGLSTSRTRQQIDGTTRQSYLDLLKSVDVSRIDRGDTKSVRLMFDVTPQLLKSAQTSPAGASTVSK